MSISDIPKSLSAISFRCKKGIRDFCKNYHFQIQKNYKRSFRKGPFAVLMGVIITIVLVGYLASNSFSKSLSGEDFSLLSANASAVLNGQTSQNLFVNPVNSFSGGSPEMIFIQKNSLVAVAPPATVTSQVLGSILGTIDTEPEERENIIEYAIEQGDTLSSVAEKFNISLNTILWANDLNSKSLLKVGQKLVILPVSGLIHNVRKGDTLSEIAQIYKAKVDEIVEVNRLSNEHDIFIGDILIVPDGEMPVRSYVQSQVPIGSSYFICPHSACKITQGLHFYNAIDFGGKCGDPLYAAAGGIVQKVRYGWNAGAGNYLTILHPNGVVTMYGHLKTSLVIPGQKVSQGEIVGLMGGQPGTPGSGISTGYHVHFDVRGARNPFTR